MRLPRTATCRPPESCLVGLATASGWRRRVPGRRRSLSPFSASTKVSRICLCHCHCFVAVMFYCRHRCFVISSILPQLFCHHCFVVVMVLKSSLFCLCHCFVIVIVASTVSSSLFFHCLCVVIVVVLKSLLFCCHHSLFGIIVPPSLFCYITNVVSIVSS